MSFLMDSVVTQIAACDAYMTKLSATKARLMQELSRIELAAFIQASASSHFETVCKSYIGCIFFINQLFR